MLFSSTTNCNPGFSRLAQEAFDSWQLSQVWVLQPEFVAIEERGNEHEQLHGCETADDVSDE